MTTITRSTSDYNGIACSGSFDYMLVAGTEGAISIDGEENLLASIVTEVKNGKLIVKTDNKFSLQPSKNKNIKITIPFKDIDNVSLAGSGDLWTKDQINTEVFSVSLAGSGDIKLTIKSTKTDASIAGSGDLTLLGTTNSLEASVSGSGNFHGFELISNNTDVSVAGSGDADVVGKDTLKARVAGSGDIRYRGKPTKQDSKVAGSGSIQSE